MATAKMPKRRAEGDDEAAVRERILEAAFVGVHEERLRNDQHA